MNKNEDRAALFTTGGSQAVRLPKEYRFEGSAVRIRRAGRAVVLEPLEKTAWPEGYWERLDALRPLPDDFTAPEPLPPTPHAAPPQKAPVARALPARHRHLHRNPPSAGTCGVTCPGAVPGGRGRVRDD
ncbi:MAG: AbrB/MazE/SpoVT family DNA-binding domain-containing protein [Gemmatimonadetes bacterium]|nr:AbrB/MazE/SpoVT family DNA-binding domain-containing protein [Gemmatimonadota bacterium]